MLDIWRQAQWYPPAVDSFASNPAAAFVAFIVRGWTQSCFSQGMVGGVPAVLRVPDNASPRCCCRVPHEDVLGPFSPSASLTYSGVLSKGWVSSAWWGYCGDEPRVVALIACTVQPHLPTKPRLLLDPSQRQGGPLSMHTGSEPT